MADGLITPPITRENTPHDFPSSAEDEAVCHLDALLTQYLELLDQYTKLRAELTTSFAQGFLSLAYAQRNSNLGPGRRYGQENYDGRMKALRRVKVEERSSLPALGRSAENSELKQSGDGSHAGRDRLTIHVLPHPQTGRTGSEETKAAKREGATVPCSNEKSGTRSTSPSQRVEEKTDRTKPDPGYRDPLAWYGILVPPPLRQAQKEFSLSAEGTIPQLLNTVSSLNAIESQIWAARANLGLQEDGPLSEISSATD